MSIPHRLDPYDLAISSDEELPDYETARIEAAAERPVTAPTYAESNYDRPLYTYTLQQIDRKLQLWVPQDGSASTYKTIARPTLRVFSKKQPDMAILRVLPDMTGETNVATLNFDDNGPLPWRPRARVSLSNEAGIAQNHGMESRNFTDWTLSFSESEPLAWRLESEPISIVLSEVGADMLIARFTYSRYGTRAVNGAPVGELTIYWDALSTESDGVEKIIATLMVPVLHFKKMGRMYYNEASVRAQSLSREHQQGYRSGALQHSVTGLYAA